MVNVYDILRYFTNFVYSRRIVMTAVNDDSLRQLFMIAVMRRKTSYTITVNSERILRPFLDVIDHCTAVYGRA